jgi:hypothetical protein
MIEQPQRRAAVAAIERLGSVNQQTAMNVCTLIIGDAFHACDCLEVIFSILIGLREPGSPPSPVVVMF